MTSGHFQYAVIAAAIAAAVVLVVRFEVFCLTDVFHTDERDLKYLSRAGWVAACLLFIPIGGILYLRYGRER